MLQRQDAPPVCAICLENIGPTTELARPSVCKHTFCRACLECLCRSSAHGQRRCPLDRKPFGRFCVLGPAGETVYDAATLVQLDRIFASRAVPASLTCALLAVLLASPSWMLAVHIASMCGVYWYTEGIANRWLYIVHCVGICVCFVPDLHVIGFCFTAYAIICDVLAVLLPDLAPRNLSPEMMLLLLVTCTLLCLVLPAIHISMLALAQPCCYVLCVLLIYAMKAKLGKVFVHRYVHFSLLCSSPVILPFLVRLSNSSGPILVYNLMLAGYFIGYWDFIADSATDAGQPQHRSALAVCVLLSKVACHLVPAVILDIPKWSLFYTVALLAYLGGHFLFNLVESVCRGVPLMVSSVIIGILFPCYLFGLLAHLGSLVLVCGSCYLQDQLIKCVNSLPNALLFFLLPLQFGPLRVLHTGGNLLMRS